MCATAFTEKTIASGFRKTGIFPFDPDIVLKQLPGERPQTPEQEKKNESPTPSSIPSTPTSVRTLKRQADKLHATVMSPSVRRSLLRFLKGAVALATSESLAFQQLTIQTDAQHERAQRQQKTRQTLPKCGVITFEDAKRRVKEITTKKKR